MIMFDMFGIKTSLAFIPFYNTYLIYKEYKGRVWKKIGEFFTQEHSYSLC